MKRPKIAYLGLNLWANMNTYGPTGSPEYEEQYPPAPGIQLQPVKDFVPLFFAFHCPHVCKGPFGASFISKTTTFLSELVQTCVVQAKKVGKLQAQPARSKF